jgi:hypothetical protein
VVSIQLSKSLCYRSSDLEKASPYTFRMIRKNRLLLILAFVSSLIIPMTGVHAEESSVAWHIPNACQPIIDSYSVYSIGVIVGISDSFNPGCVDGISIQGYSRSTGASAPFNTDRALLPNCSPTIQMFCIIGLDARKVDDPAWSEGVPSPVQPRVDEHQLLASGTNIEGQYFSIYASVYSESVLSGGSATVWQLPGFEHGGGADYLVEPTVDHTSTSNSSLTDASWNFLFRITPIKLGPSRWLGTGQPPDYSLYDFPSNVEYRLKLKWDDSKVPFEKTWNFGRIAGLQIMDDQISKTISISGSPVTTPIAILNPLPISTIPISERDTAGWRLNDKCLSNCLEALGTGWEWTSLVDALPGWETLGMKTVGHRSNWSVRSRLNQSTNTIGELSGSEYPESCQNYLGLGFVTTNATSYYAGIPKWNSTTHSIEFKVASTHLNELNQPNLGYYQIGFKKTLADCLWGQGIDVSQVHISIVNLDGKEQHAALTSATVRNSMFYFTATGFTYSSPTIKVFVNEAQKDASSSKSALPSKKTAGHSTKVKTISCLRGHEIKKITKLSPKCPPGYKLKK